MSLYNKLLFIKHNYWHIFAHKPLCEKYKNDVLKIKKVYLCRSCSFLYLGLIVGIFIKISALFYVVLLTLTCLFSSGKVYKNFNRKVRDILRFSLGFLLANTFYFLIALDIAGFYGVSIFLISLQLYYKKRKSRKLKECSSCHEFDDTKICSGFEMQSPSIKKFENELTKIAYKKRGINYEFE